MDCGRSRNNKRSKKEGIKVVYISTPMKVKTSASKFRALVQELTGRHSDTARFMTEDAFTAADHHHALPQSSSDDSFKQLPWDQETFDGQAFPFSSLFVNDHSNFNYYYHDHLDPVSGFAAAL